MRSQTSRPASGGTSTFNAAASVRNTGGRLSRASRPSNTSMRVEYSWSTYVQNPFLRADRYWRRASVPVGRSLAEPSGTSSPAAGKAHDMLQCAGSVEQWIGVLRSHCERTVIEREEV